MATQGYSGSVDLISGIRPKNNGTFPLVDAHDVYVAGPDKRLDTALTEKADKTDTYTQSEVDTKIASAQTFSKSIVETLPEAASADDKTIYLVPRANSETPDLCDEYVVVEELGAKRWERIGGTTIDVDGKRDKTDLAVYDRLANWTSSSGAVARWDHGTFWLLAPGGYLEYIRGREWVLYDLSLDGSTHSITADENALSLTFSVPVDGGEPEEITFTRPSVYASSGDSLAKRSELQNLQNVDLPAKLDSTSAAPAFNKNAPYHVGDYVTYNGKLYRCTTAVAWQTAAPWNAANWTAVDMTTPDAMLDVTSAGRLRLVDTDDTVLWQQGYDLAAEFSETLSCDKVNLFAFAATTVPAFDDTATYAVNDRVTYNGAIYKCTTAVETAGAWTGAANWIEDPDTQAFSLPTAPNGKVGDFILDIDNSANTVAATATLTGLDTAFSIVVPSGQSLSQMLIFAAGEMAELYFTQTAFKVNNLPTWKLVKQVVENGGAQA